MDVRFKYNEPAEAEKIYFEQIFAEKPGGGVVVKGEVIDIPPTTPVVESPSNPGRYMFYLQFVVYEDTPKGTPILKIEKTPYRDSGPNVFPTKAIGFKKQAVEIQGFSTADPNCDKISLKASFSSDLKKGDILYIAKAASEDNAEVDWETSGGKPVFVTGDWVYANQGDQAVRLINGANLRKETANIASEVAALLPGINLV